MTAPDPRDPLALSRALIRCPSVTPRDEGALTVVAEALESLGFGSDRMTFAEPGHEDVDNLYARRGDAAPLLCFAGHTDVVPVGDPTDWTHDPFAAEVRDGVLYGRGAVDMKGAIAAFIAATARFLEAGGDTDRLSLGFIITGDEEAVSINGTRKMLGWMAERDQRPTACVVGEPTSDETLGDMIKIGRRGALNGRLTVHGIQGHAAYSELADNPVHHLVRMLDSLTSESIDQGSAHFPPTSLQITSVDVGNTATNVIPAKVTAVFDCRFSDLQTSETVLAWMRERLDRDGARYDMNVRVSGESFLCPPGPLSDLASGAVRDVLGLEAALGTTGGTSDARFIKDVCPVAELGLRNATAHKVDEQVTVAELESLTAIYQRIIEGAQTTLC